MFIPKPRLLFRFAAVSSFLLGTSVLATCTDGIPLTEVSQTPTVSFAVNPVVDPALADVASAPIQRIRIVGYLAGTDSILGQMTQDVDPNAAQWSLDFSISASPGTAVQIILTVELINLTGGKETVQWSGRVGPFSVLPGSNHPIMDVGVVRGPLDNLSVTAVSIQGPIQEILEESTLQLSGTAASSNPSDKPRIFWTSLDPSVALISSNGLLTGVSPGTSQIVATAGIVADTVMATVRARPADVRIMPESVFFEALGEEEVFTATVLDRRGALMPGESVTWAVEAPEILEDQGEGRFRARARGATVVTASSVSAPEVTASVRVEVRQVVGSVEVMPESGLLSAREDTLRFTAQAFDNNGNPISGMSFYWSTDNTYLATIDAEGLATAMNSGVVAVSARAATGLLSSVSSGVAIPGLVGEATLEVNRAVDRVELSPDSHGFTSLGEGVVLTALALDRNGFTIPGKTFQWNTSNLEVATVNQAGLTLAVAEGDAVIAAATDGHQGSASVTVNQVATALRWATPPSDGSTGIPLDPPPSVEAMDELGTRVTSFEGLVQVEAILLPPGSPTTGTITGTPVATAVNGMAVFTDLAIEPGGTYVLSARSGSLGPAVSETFVIGGAAPLARAWDVLGNTELITGGYSAPTTPHLYDAANLLSGTPGLTVTSVGTSASTGGGSVTMEADGDFSYTPPPGFKGTDSFIYAVGGGLSATVTITVADMVWYVDNRGSPYGTGLSNDPFASPAQAITATLLPADPDRIFIHYGDGSAYDGNIQLRGTQILEGEGVGLALAAWPNLVAPGPGSAPVLTSASSFGVSLGDGSTLRGVDIANTGSSGILANDITDGLVEEVNITGGANGIFLSIASGTFDFVNVTITDPQTTGVAGLNILEGDADITFGGAISNSNSGAWSLQVGGRTGGTVTMDGTIVDSGRGVQIGGSAGANSGGAVVINGSMDLSGPGIFPYPPFNAYSTTTNGTLEVTSAFNTISAPPGYAALFIYNTEIGARDVTFRSVSADGNASVTRGVLLYNTGASGTFRITGDGSTPGSGGSIANMGQEGINMFQTGPVSFSWMDISIPGGIYGILGTTIDGFNLIGSNITGAAYLVRLSGLTGNSLISNSTLTNPAGGEAFEVSNSTGSFTLDLVSSTFSTSGSTTRNGASILTSGDATGVVNVQGSTFTDSRNGLLIQSSVTSGLELNVSGNSVFSNNSYTGLDLNVAASANLKFDVRNSQFNANTSLGVQGRVAAGAAADAELSGELINNQVTGGQSGITFQYLGDATGFLRIQGNTVSSQVYYGITALAGLVGAAYNASVGVEISGNNVGLAATGITGINTAVSANTSICSAVSGNTVTLAGGGNTMRLTQSDVTSALSVEGLNGGSGFVTDLVTIRDYLDSLNTLPLLPNVSFQTGVSGVPAGSCVPLII